MILEAINRLFDMGKASRMPEVLPLPGDKLDAERIHVVLADGTLEEMPLRPGICDTTAYDIPGFAAMMDYAWNQEGEQAIIYIGRLSILGLRDSDATDRGAIKMALTFGDAFGRLVYEHNTYDQRQLTDLLRYACERVDPATLISACSDLKFRKEQQEHQSAGAGKGSLGSDITQEVHGAEGPLPETVALTIKPYNNADFEASIACTLRVDFDSRTFILKAQPGEVDRVWSEATAFVAKAISRATSKIIPVFIGMPLDE